MPFLPYPTEASTSKGSLDVGQVRSPASMPLEVTITNASAATTTDVFVLSTECSPGIYSIRIKGATTAALFAVSRHATTRAPSIALLAATDVASVGPLVSTAFAAATTTAKTNLIVYSTTGLQIQNRTGGDLTYYFDRVV